MLALRVLSLFWLSTAMASLPYLPTIALTPRNNDSLVYVFQPSSDYQSASVIRVNASNTITPQSPVTTLTSSVPFLSSTDTSFVPFIDTSGDLFALAGQCADGPRNTSLWSLKTATGQEKDDWIRIDLDTGNSNLSVTNTAPPVNFLAAGFAFSNPLNNTPTLYTFGGMCPNASTSSLSAEDWQASANYSDSLWSTIPRGLLSSSSFATVASADDHFRLDQVTSSKGPPIEEAGFSVTALEPLMSGPNGTHVQQNLVLIGGHTADAFINMSQIAMLSLPEQSWSFVPVADSQSQAKELAKRQTQVIEPRSGHTAVLSEDGSSIVVLGGWVGDINTPAEPQLAVLDVGSGFGGKGEWKWSVPDVEGMEPSGNGIYGHGAVMLPGNIMMITGGHAIRSQGSKTKRDAMGIRFYNLTSSSWSANYLNPNSQSDTGNNSQHSKGLRSGQKIGLGVGLGLGIPLFFVVLALIFCLRRHRKRKDERRSLLIDHSIIGSWSSPGVQSIEGSPQPMTERSDTRQVPPRGMTAYARTSHENQDSGWRNTRTIEAERTGLLVEIPSPTRGLRRGNSKAGYHHAHTGSNTTTQIPVIDEMDEVESSKSAVKSPILPELDLGGDFSDATSPTLKAPSPHPLQRRSILKAPSDPFLDPDAVQTDPFATQPSSPVRTPDQTREQEVNVWGVGGGTVQPHFPRQEEKSRPQSGNRSLEKMPQRSVSPLSGKPPNNSNERTESNISDRSMHSAVSFLTEKSGKSSNPSINRNLSQRSTNVFSVINRHTRDQAASKRSVRRSLPKVGAFTNAINALQSTPPGQAALSDATPRSIAFGVGNPPAHIQRKRLPSFGTLQAESQILLGSPHGDATQITNSSTSDSLQTEAEYTNPEGDEEFPRRPTQGRSRRLMGGVRNVLSTRSRNRSTTNGGSVSSTGSPTTATFSSGSPNRTATATPYSLMRGPGGSEQQEVVPQPSELNTGSGPPRRTASIGSAPWRDTRSGARDWGWYDQDRPRSKDKNLDTGRLSIQNTRGKDPRLWRRSSPGATTAGMLDFSSNRSDVGGDWDVESAVERRCVQVMFTVPKERLRVVNAGEGEADTASLDTRDNRYLDDEAEDYRPSLEDVEAYYHSPQAGTSRYYDHELDDDVELRGGGAGYVSEGEGLMPGRLRPKNSRARVGSRLWEDIIQMRTNS